MGYRSSVSPIGKRDVLGVIKTIAFLAAAFALYVGASWLWESYGSERLGPLLGPTVDGFIGLVARFGNMALEHMTRAFLSWVLMPTVSALSYLSPRAGKVLSENHFLFMPLLITVLFVLYLLFSALALIARKMRGTTPEK